MPNVRTRTGVLRRPLLGLTTSFILGLLMGEAWVASIPALLACALVGLLLAVILRRSVPATLSLHLAVMLIGAAHVQVVQRTLAPADLTVQMNRDRERLHVVGVVADDPSTIISDSGEHGWAFPLRVESMERAGQWQVARGRCEVRWTPGAQDCEVRYGQRWSIEGPALRREARPGQAPEVLISLRGASAHLLSAGHGSRLRAWCLDGRRACARLLGRGIEDDPNAAGIMRAFMLGYREELPERAHRAFSRTGTLHIAAISGAHVVILAGLLLIPLKALGFSQTRWIYVMGPLLVLYALGTGLAASAVRACIMACVFWSAHAFRRRPDGPSALAFSALLILAVAPGQLWEAGFLLSFGVVAGLMLLVSPLSEPWLARLQTPRPLPVTRARRLVVACARPILSLVAVTLAAWLTSLPMTAQYFNLFSPVGLVANLFVVPLASLILLNGCLVLTLGWLSGLGAEIFNHASRVLVDLLLWLVGTFHRWPGGHWFVTAPSGWWAAAWYGWLVLMAQGGRRMRQVGTWCAVGVLLIAGVWLLRAGRTELSFTPMGRGLAVLVDGPGRSDLLVDPGPAYRGRDVVRWLHSRGVNRLQAVVLTRATAETAGALPAVLEEIPVQQIWVPASPIRSTAMMAILQKVRASGREIVTLGCGDEGMLAGGLHWQILHPSRTGTYASAAQGCLVVRFSQGPASVVLAGSVHPKMQTEILGRGEDIAAAGLIVTGGEPGSRWLPEWQDAVRPYAEAHPLVETEGEDEINLIPGAQPCRVEPGATSRWRLAAPTSRGSLLAVLDPERWR